MSEKGKIIKATFDTDDLQYSSIAGNESNFVISATEKRFVPGGDDVATEYTVEEIEGDVIRVKKADFADGTKTNTEIQDDELVLTSSPGEVQVGPDATGTPGSHTAQYGLKIVATQSFKIKSASIYCYTTSNYTAYLYKGTSLIASKNFTPVTTGWTYVELNFTGTTTGDYWLGLGTGTHAAAGREAYANFPQSNEDIGITIPGGQLYGSSTTNAYWYYFYDLKFETLTGGTYETNGTWTYPINADSITDVFNSIAQWTETKPTGTDITVYTGLSTSDTTEPSTWTEQTSNGGAIQSISENEDLTGKYLWVKIELETTDTGKTPAVSDPLFIIRKLINARALRLLISGWAGINKATGDIRIQYNATSGTLAGDAAGHAQVVGFDETFTPTGLQPINNPGILEALKAALTDYSITRTLITFIDAFSPDEALEIGLTNYEITRTHIDDLPP